MPHGLCHFTVNARNLASDRSEVPASDASRVVKWIRKNNFLVPCIYLEVQKLCCLHYNMLLHIPGLEPYPTPSSVQFSNSSGLEIQVWHAPQHGVRRGHGTASPRTERTLNLAAGWREKASSPLAALVAALHQSSLFFDRAKDHFSPKHKCVCEDNAVRGVGSQPHGHQEHLLIGLLLPRQRQYAFSALHHP